MKTSIMRIAGVLATCLILCAASGRIQDAPDRYNYQKAMEALRENMPQKAVEFCQKDLDKNPKDPRTLSLLAYAYHCTNQDDEALKLLNRATKLWTGLVGKDVVNPYYMRAEVLLAQQDTLQAIADMERALHITDNGKDIREELMSIHFVRGEYSKVEETAQAALKEDSESNIPNLYLGWIACKDERWDEVLEYLGKVNDLNEEDMPQVCLMRAMAHWNKGNVEAAANELVGALQDEDDEAAFNLMQTIAEDKDGFEAMRKNLEAQVAADGDTYYLYCLGAIHEIQGQDTPAVVYYKMAVEQGDESETTCERLMECCSRLGEFEDALYYADEVLNKNSNHQNALRLKSELLVIEGRPDEGIVCANKLVELAPDNATVYDIRGDILRRAGMPDEAVKDYESSLTLVPQDCHTRLQHGKCLAEMGEKKKAEADFWEVLKTDAKTDANSMSHYAYFFLGEKASAKSNLAQILKSDSTAEAFYNAACLYSLLNDTTTSRAYLERAKAAGFNDLVRMALNTDLDNLRRPTTFKVPIVESVQKEEEPEVITVSPATSVQKTFVDEPVAKEEQKPVTKVKVSNDEQKLSTKVIVPNEEQKSTAKATSSSTQKTSANVPFSREGGVCKVKCELNGMPSYFIIDAGKTEATLSLAEANFMLKNGYLSGKDVSKRDPDTREVKEGATVTIQKVDFSGLTLFSLHATVVRNQKVPLMLDRHVLDRLGRIEIDNKQQVLRITPNKSR